MKVAWRRAAFESDSDNRKSVWSVAIAIVFVLCGATVQGQQQQTRKSARVAYLDISTAADSATFLDDFRRQMTQFNWIEGKNLTIDYRYAEGRLDRLEGLAAELVGLKVYAIVVDATNAAAAAKKATNTIPIVMATSTDPVAAGLVASLARPGGNITGNAGFSDDLAGKRLELLRRCFLKLHALLLSKAVEVEQVNFS